MTPCLICLTLTNRYIADAGQLRLQGSKWDKAEKDFSEGLRIRRGYAARMRRTGSGAIKVPASYTSGEKRVFAQATWEAELAEADGRTAYSLCDLAFAYTKKKVLVHLSDVLIVFNCLNCALIIARTWFVREIYCRKH